MLYKQHWQRRTLRSLFDSRSCGMSVRQLLVSASALTKSTVLLFDRQYPSDQKVMTFESIVKLTPALRAAFLDVLNTTSPTTTLAIPTFYPPYLYLPITGKPLYVWSCLPMQTTTRCALVRLRLPTDTLLVIAHLCQSTTHNPSEERQPFLEPNHLGAACRRYQHNRAYGVLGLERCRTQSLESVHS
jgi:hypothetical protein